MNNFRRFSDKIVSKMVMTALKGPKLEIFGSRVFPQIRPVCVGDLGTRRKNSKFCWFRLENRRFVLFSAVADIAKHF
jgi:hypothetical protein